MSRKNQIEKIINQELAPLYLNVENESKNHHVPEGSQTHFKLTVISTQFAHLSLVERHRLLNRLLKEEFELGMHALSMHLFTPEEWEKKNKMSLKSPHCKGGSKKE